MGLREQILDNIRAEIRKYLRDGVPLPKRDPRWDCGDNSCRYRYRDPNVLGGMRTNGGCRCADNHPNELRWFTLKLKRFADDLLSINWS